MLSTKSTPLTAFGLALASLLVAGFCLADCPPSQTLNFLADAGAHPSSVAVEVKNFGKSAITLQAFAYVAADPAGALPVLLPAQIIAPGATATFSPPDPYSQNPQIYQVTTFAPSSTQSWAFGVSSLSMSIPGTGAWSAQFPAAPDAASAQCGTTEELTFPTSSSDGTVQFMYGQFISVDGTVLWATTSIPPPPPQFTYDLTAAAAADPTQTRLLTHAYSGSAFSAFQLAQPNTVPPTATRPQMSIDGTVTNGPTANEIWFKLIDPPDNAVYVPTTDAHSGDNRDGQAALLRTFDGAAQTTVGGPAIKTTWNAQNRVRVVLEGSDHVSGDNYQVIASFAAPDASGNFPCSTDKPCVTSPRITVWKRISVDSYSMYRRGVFFAANAAVGDREILVRENAAGQQPPFAPGDAITLLGGIPDHLSEAVVIDPHPVDAQGNALLPIESAGNNTWRIRLKTQLQHAYIGKVPPANVWGADAVGIAGSYFTADTSSLASFLGDMLVDVVSPTNTIAFPYFPELPNPNNNATEAVLAARFALTKQPNLLHLIGAGRYVATPIPPSGSQPPNCSTNFGDTVHGGGQGNFSYVYVGNINAAVAGPVAPCVVPFPRLLNRNATGINQGAVAHEIAHQFSVNPTSAGGHCTRMALVPPAQSGDLCLMNKVYPASATNPSQLDTPRIAFHWINHGQDSEYTQVRTCAEPVNQ